MYRKAHDKLYELWGHKENKSEEKWREIFRLLFADKDNPERFRQGYSQVSAVQYNREAYNSFSSLCFYSSSTKIKLLKKDELPEESFYNQLENYLRQGDWRKADEETAWLFLVVMEQQGYGNCFALFADFPNTILEKIDLLWVHYSEKRFGFSIQKHIWQNIEQKFKWEKKLEEFGRQIGWSCIRVGETVKFPFPTELVLAKNIPYGNLPARCYLQSGLFRYANPDPLSSLNWNSDYFRHLFEDLLFPRLDS